MSWSKVHMSLVSLTARDDIWTFVFGALFLWSNSCKFVQMLIQLLWAKLDILMHAQVFQFEVSFTKNPFKS